MLFKVVKEVALKPIGNYKVLQNKYQLLGDNF